MLGTIKYTVVIIDEIKSSSQYHIVEILVSKKEVKKKKSHVFLEKEKFYKAIPKYNKTLLHFVGKDVLSKPVDQFEDNITKQVLPSASTKDFFAFRYENEKSKIASIYRQNLLDEWLNELSDNGVRVNEIFLGYATLEIVPKPVHNNIKSVGELSFEYDDHQLLRLNGSVSDENVSFGGQSYTGYEALALCDVQAYLSGKTESQDIDEIAWHQDESKWARRFYVAGIASLLFFFVFLLGNYFYLQKLLQENVEKEGQLLFYKDEVKAIENLEAQLKNKKQLLEKSGVSGTQFLTFYVYDLFKNLGDAIVVEKCEVKPIVDKIKSNEIIQFDQNNIIVHGAAMNEQDLKLWMADVKGKPWVNNVKLNNYQLDQDDLGKFEISIEVKNV